MNIGKLLCWLGLHQPVVTVLGDRNQLDLRTGRLTTSAFGFCARCNEPYQWDH